MSDIFRTNGLLPKPTRGLSLYPLYVESLRGLLRSNKFLLVRCISRSCFFLAPGLPSIRARVRLSLDNCLQYHDGLPHLVDLRFSYLQNLPFFNLDLKFLGQCSYVFVQRLHFPFQLVNVVHVQGSLGIRWFLNMVLIEYLLHTLHVFLVIVEPL